MSFVVIFKTLASLPQIMRTNFVSIIEMFMPTSKTHKTVET